MNSQTKQGKVYIQPHKSGKKWKAVWLCLFPPSSSGMGRLEIQDMGGGTVGNPVTEVRRHYQPHMDRKLKVVPLSELTSVLRLPPNAEACPMENMSAFCVETQDRTIVFAAPKDDCLEWVEKLCYNTFQRGAGSGFHQLQMEENQIYVSTEQVSEFWVMVQTTDAAMRCGLKGSYWLQVGKEALLLRETQKKNIIREWPYELLRRYGQDKLSLTIEAGRRCDSGPGSFTFETQQAERIFSQIQSAIKQKTSTVTVGNQNEKSGTIIRRIQGQSPLAKVPDATSMASILGNKLKKQECQSAAVKETADPQEDVVGSSESISIQPAPITLMPLPLVPTHDRHSLGKLGDQLEAEYADPADCIQSLPQAPSPMALYVDPASILPLKPPSSVISPPDSSAANHCFTTNEPDPVYSEVYDKISPVQNKETITQSKVKMKCCADDEPIYTQPMSKKEEVSHKNESKENPFAELYAQVCKITPSSNTRPSCSASSSTFDASMSTVNVTDQSLDDVIYENHGIL